MCLDRVTIGGKGLVCVDVCLDWVTIGGKGLVYVDVCLDPGMSLNDHNYESLSEVSG